MTNITQFSGKECSKIDPLSVNAYFELSLDSTNNNLLVLDTSWGCTKVDLAPIVAQNETITHLFITPEGSLQYNREDYGREGAENGGVDCITGYDLSRIVSMRYLKDVDQTTAPTDGQSYMYNGDKQLFEPFALKQFVSNTNNMLEQHGASITNLVGTLQAVQNTLTTVLARLSAVEKRMTTAEGNITNLQSRVSSIESQIARPAGVPTNTRLVYGNINYNSDHTNSGQLTSGLYSHSPSNKVINDAYDA